jgi:hypothetical protein
MNKTILTGTILMLASPLAFGQERRIDRSALPEPVLKTVQEQSQGATVQGFTTEVEHGKRVYEAEMMLNGRSRDIEIASDGALIEVEEEVDFNSLPASVQSALKTRAAGARIAKVESLTKHNKLVAYEASTLKGSHHGEVQVGPDGAKLAHGE